MLAGGDAVPDVIAQPDLPQELRPPGVPLPRPGRVSGGACGRAAPAGQVAGAYGQTPKPAPLLPQPDAEPGVVYVAPFITLMVPAEVRERIFDQFVDTLNQRGAERKLKFVILKQGLDKVDRSWLGARKYVLGEVYGYVEDSGCCSTDLRTRPDSPSTAPTRPNRPSSSNIRSAPFSIMTGRPVRGTATACRPDRQRSGRRALQNAPALIPAEKIPFPLDIAGRLIIFRPAFGTRSR